MSKHNFPALIVTLMELIIAGHRNSPITNYFYNVRSAIKLSYTRVVITRKYKYDTIWYYGNKVYSEAVQTAFMLSF